MATGECDIIECYKLGMERMETDQSFRDFIKELSYQLELQITNDGRRARGDLEIKTMKEAYGRKERGDA